MSSVTESDRILSAQSDVDDFNTRAFVLNAFGAVALFVGLLALASAVLLYVVGVFAGRW